MVLVDASGCGDVQGVVLIVNAMPNFPNKIIMCFIVILYFIPQDVIWYLYQMTSALDYIHQYGIIHR